MDPREPEVLRLLARYLDEIVEPYELCPWARPARLAGELATRVIFGEPTATDFAEAARVALAPGIAVAMVIAPEYRGDLAALRALRDQVAAALPAAGVAEFHPDAPLDLATPARLIPFLRRSPDPLLQLVPLSILTAARAQPPPPDRARQAQIMAGLAAPPREDVAARIAATNHARVTPAHAELVARFADLAADRARSYARLGINAYPRP